MDMKIDSSVAGFLENCASQLEKDATINSFVLSLAARCESSGRPVQHLARGLDKKGNLLIAGIQTDLNRPLVLSKSTNEAAGFFASQLERQVSSLPGVTGPSPAVESFVEEWCVVKNCHSKLERNLRLFELTSLKPARACAGFFRVATSEHEKIIFQWLREFHEEAIPHEPKMSDEDLYKDIRAAFSAEQYFVWVVEGKCVSLVGSRRETSSGRWIGPVYTPKSERGHGYASALTAAVSQRIIDAGKKAILFTDMENPTSNSIYQKLGYEFVADFKAFFFTEK